ncbi:MAG: cytochrome P450 [Cocleimonas sp.]
MSDFIPPFPKRHKDDISPFKALYYAQNDLLSIWDEESFTVQFMHRKILKQNVFIANCPELIRYVFVENKGNYERKSPQMRHALEPLLGDGLFVSDGDTWSSRRKIQTPLFDSAHIKMFTDTMISTINEMADDWQTKINVNSVSELDVHPEMGKLTAEIIARTLFGEKLGSENSSAVVEAFAEYQSVVKQTNLANFLGLPDWLPNLNAKFGKGRRAAKAIHDTVDDIIEKAEEGGHEGTLVAEFLKANQGDSGIDLMTKQQIRNELIVLFMAGHETTANVLAWAWYLISQAPDVEAKLHAELDKVLDGRKPEMTDVESLIYTRAILDETMRLYPPVPILSREAKEEDTIRNTKVPPGSIMLIVPWLIHRHKKYWDKPDHFIPERFMPDAPKPIKFSYIPFSAGPRVCLGKNFGIVESVLTIAMLAQRFRLSMAKDKKVEHECRLTLRPKGRLPMKIKART